MRRYLPLAMVPLACGIALFANSTNATRGARDTDAVAPEAVLYGVGEADPGTVARLHRASTVMNPAVDEVLASTETDASGRWTIRHVTTTADGGLYFSLGDTSQPISVLSPLSIDLAPTVPSALIVVRPTRTSSDTWVVY